MFLRVFEGQGSPTGWVTSLRLCVLKCFKHIFRCSLLKTNECPLLKTNEGWVLTHSCLAALTLMVGQVLAPSLKTGVRFKNQVPKKPVELRFAEG